MLGTYSYHEIFRKTIVAFGTMFNNIELRRSTEVMKVPLAYGPSQKFLARLTQQSDLNKANERNGIVDFMNILRKMPSFDIIEFGIDDVVRSGLVKEYLTAKMEAGF